MRVVDGGGPVPAAWRSSIPGVYQREGATASLGVVVRDGGATGPAIKGRTAGDRDWSSGAAGGPAHRRIGLRAGPRRGRRVVGFAALALAFLGVVLVARMVPPPGADPAAAWELPAGTDAPDAPEAPLGAQGSDAAPEVDPGPEQGPGDEAADIVPNGGAGVQASGVGIGGADRLAGQDEEPDWWEVLAVLDARRAEVLVSGDESGLSGYAAPGSPAWLTDEAMLANLESQGVRPAGLESRILAIEVVSEVDVGVALQVVDLRSGYDLVEESTGESVGYVEPAGATRWTITLAPLDLAQDVGPGLPEASPTPGEPDPGWRVVSVEAA